MQLGNLRHDGEIQTRAGRFDRASAPKSLKDTFPIFAQHTGSLVRHDNRAVSRNADRHLRPRRRMRNGVLDEIAQRIADRVGIAANPNRIVRRGGRLSHRSVSPGAAAFGGIATS